MNYICYLNNTKYNFYFKIIFVILIMRILFSDQKCMDLSNLSEDDQTFIDGNSSNL